MLEHVNLADSFWQLVGNRTDKPRWIYSVPWRNARIFHKLAEVRKTNDGRYTWFRKRVPLLEPELTRSGPMQGVCQTLEDAKKAAIADLRIERSVAHVRSERS